MSRFFSGAREGKSSAGKASKAFMEALKKGNGGPGLSDQEVYDKIFSDKMAAAQKEISVGGKYGVMMPGAAKPVQRQLSKSAQAVVEKLAAERAREEAKKAAKKNVKVVAKNFFGGGRMDSSGNIYDGFGRKVAKVDAKSGKIKNGWGVSVGSYKADGTSDGTIQHLISKSNMKNPVNSWDPVTGGMGGGTGGGSIYSTGGSVYGPTENNNGWW